MLYYMASMAQTAYNCDDARRHHILYSVFYLNTRTSTKTTTHRKKKRCMNRKNIQAKQKQCATETTIAQHQKES